MPTCASNMIGGLEHHKDFQSPGLELLFFSKKCDSLIQYEKSYNINGGSCAFIFIVASMLSPSLRSYGLVYYTHQSILPSMTL